MRFDGSDFDQQIDGPRLERQMDRIRDYLIAHPEWHTLHDLGTKLNYPEASVSAQLRNLRKERFGGYEIARRRVAALGTWEYRLVGRLGHGS